jgi:hypothetical protein
MQNRNRGMEVGDRLFFSWASISRRSSKVLSGSFFYSRIQYFSLDID